MIYLVAAIAIVATLLFILEKLWTRPRKHFKRPPGLPILGHIQLVNPDVFLKDVMKSALEYGPFVQLNVLNLTYLVITDADTIKEALLKRPKTFRRPRLFEPSFSAIGLWPHSLFVAEGSLWNRLRKATSAPFNKVCLVVLNICLYLFMNMYV